MFHSKMRFFFEMCFRFQNVKGFINVVFPFSEKHDCKQKFVNKDSFTGEVVKQQEIYIKLLNLFLLSRIYNLLQECLPQLIFQRLTASY